MSRSTILRLLLGSVLTLLAILAMYLNAGTTDITTLLTHGFPRSWQPWLFLAFLASFSVKLANATRLPSCVRMKICFS